LKYKGDIGLAEILARPLVAMLSRLAWEVDFVTPVPASRIRRSQRGYNQASLIARPVALARGLPFKSGALEKIRDTRSQVELTLPERRTNLTGAFRAAPGLCRGKRILLVDDVTTSGSTILECTHALLDGGARQVYVLTLSRAILDNPKTS
jgi:ComF family protein